MCFTNYILTRGSCGTTVPTSGLFTDQIGFTKEILNEVVSNPYVNGNELGQEKISDAVAQVENEVLSFLNPKLRADSIIDGQRIGYPQENLNQIAGGDLRGIEIELCNKNDYLSFYLSRLSLQVSVTGNTNVLVYDLISGILIDTITVATVANVVSEVFPARTYESESRRLHLIFVYSSTGINSNTTQVSGSGCTTCKVGKLVSLNTSINARGISITAAQAKIESNLLGRGDTAGMSMIYSLNCNYNDWLCQNSNMLSYGILYRAGINLCDYVLDDSQKLGTQTLINRESFESKRSKLQDSYDDWQNRTLDNMKLPTSRCFMCNKKIQYKTILP